MVEVVVKKQILIKGLSPALSSKIKKTLTLPNPTYYKMNKGGHIKLWIKKNYKYYKEVKEGLVVPRGLRSRIISFLQKTGLEYTADYKVIDKEMTGLKTVSDISMRDYQKPLVEDVVRLCKKNKNKSTEGILLAGTGTGKTIMAAEIIHQLGKTATIVVPTTVILNQFVSVFKDKYGVDVGQVGGGKKDVKDITVTTVQSLKAEDPVTIQLVSQTSVLVWDEVQNCVGRSWSKVARMFRAKVMLGLTGTPKRTADDGRTKAIHFFFGDIITSHEGTQLTPSVQIIKTGVDIPVGEYQEIVEEMVENKKRNHLIAKLTTVEMIAGRRILILTKRIQHYKNIFECFPKQYRDSGLMLQIDSKDKNRDKLLSELKEGKKDFSVVLGTTSLLSVGTDIPSFDTLMLACDMKSDILLVQSAGRILRVFEDKQDPVIFDFADDKNPILMNQFWQRRKIYKRKGWKTSF